MYQHLISHQVHKTNKLPNLEMSSTTTNGSRTIDELDGDTTVWRRCFAPDAWSAGSASLRGQTPTVGWRGIGPRDQKERTRRTPLAGYVLVDYSSIGTPATPAAAAAVGHTGKFKIPRRVDSAHISAARPNKSSQSWLGRLGPTRRAANPARLLAAPDHNNSSWSRRLLASPRAE